jgi:hypothetical protein
VNPKHKNKIARLATRRTDHQSPSETVGCQERSEVALLAGVLLLHFGDAQQRDVGNQLVATEAYRRMQQKIEEEKKPE